MLSPFAEKEAGMSLGAVGGAFLLISLPIVFVTPVVGHVSDGGGDNQNIHSCQYLMWRKTGAYTIASFNLNDF